MPRDDGRDDAATARIDASEPDLAAEIRVDESALCGTAATSHSLDPSPPLQSAAAAPPI
jgi:hypothetical protein